MPSILGLTNKMYWKYFTVGLFIIVLAWLLLADDSQQVGIKNTSTVNQVTVVEVIPSDTKVKVKAIGISVARWQTDIIAGVSGRVTNLPINTLPGDTLQKDQNLLELNDSYYQSEIQSAKARVAQTELALAKIKNEQIVAEKIANGKSRSAFGRLEPHIHSAEADLLAARAAYEHAQTQLKETQIKTPFSAIILERNVTPDQWVNSGDKLFSLAASEMIDINIGLSASSWKRLGSISKDATIEIVAPSGKRWLGKLNYLSPVMDPTTRQRSIMLEVSDPYSSVDPLLSGQQVDVIFEGPLQNSIVKAPSSVLTEDGKVWSIKNKLLILEEVELLDEQPEFVLFRYRNQSSQKRLLVRYPLSTMLEGQNVEVQQVELSL